jgi:hypothetical protein
MTKIDPLETFYVLDRCVNVILSCCKHTNTEKNRVQLQVVQLPVIWAKNHVIANKQDSKINNCPAVLCGGDEDQQINDQQL